MASTIAYILYAQLLFYLWQAAYLSIDTALALIVIFAVIGMSVLNRR